jgi:hypothetical protein
MSKRAAYQRMLTRLRDTGDVNHVIVYKLSRPVTGLTTRLSRPI